MTLPVNIDVTYGDDAGDASVKLHQQHHDTVHTAVNGLPTTYIAAPTSPSDGYALVWNATAGQWVAADRTASGQELAYAENVSGTTQTLTGAAGTFASLTDITNCSISVAASARPVWLEASIIATQTTVGIGMMQVFITETTVGNTGTRLVKSGPLPNSVDTHGNSIPVPILRLRFASIASTRAFKVQARLATNSSGGTPGVLVANAATAPSYIGAYAA